MGRRRLRGRLIALALAVPILAGCAGSEPEAEPPEPRVQGQSGSHDQAAALEASAPDGRYDASYVLESSNVPGAKDGFKSTSTYAFTFDECSDTECWGTVRAPARGSYTWDGTELAVTFDEIDRTDACVDKVGKKVEGSTFRTHTEHWAQATAADGDAPSKFEGSYQQDTAFSDFENGCQSAGPDRQHAKFSLVLERR